MAQEPLPPPNVHPDDPPFVCVQLNPIWIPYIIGLLRPAKFPEYWSGTLEENRQARRDVQNLIDLFQSNEECGEMAVCCEPQIYIYRVNPDTGRLERSTDNGNTWIPDPKDLVYQIRPNPPIVRSTLDATKCDAATNALEHIEDIITLTSEQLGTAITIFDLAVAIAGLLLEIFLIVLTGGAGAPAALAIAGLIWAACTAVFNEGKTAFDDFWDNARKDQVLCALVCTIGNDGKWTEEQYNNFKHKVRHDVTPSPALDLVMTAINAGGFQGLNQMASYGNAAGADCGSCNCDNACANTWDIVGSVGDIYGHITARNVDAGTIDVESSNINTDGHYYVYIRTGAISDCCELLLSEANPTAPSDPNPAWSDCGVTQIPDNLVSGLVGSHCVNQLLWKSTTPFQLRLTMISCA